MPLSMADAAPPFGDVALFDAAPRFRVARLLASPFAGPAARRRIRVGRLTVEVVGARCLAAADFGGTSDPYAIATITGYYLGSGARTEWPEETRDGRRSA